MSAKNAGVNFISMQSDAKHFINNSSLSEFISLNLHNVILFDFRRRIVYALNFKFVVICVDPLLSHAFHILSHPFCITLSFTEFLPLAKITLCLQQQNRKFPFIYSIDILFCQFYTFIHQLN